MNLSLSPETQKLLEKRMKCGGYHDPEDAVRAALLSLEQQDTFAEFAPGELAAILAEGERSIQEEGTLDGDEAFRARREARKSSRANKK